jgi:hypothetical protein
MLGDGPMLTNQANAKVGLVLACDFAIEAEK